MNRLGFLNIVFSVLILSSCKVILPTKPYLAKSSKIEIIGSKFTKNEEEALKSRLLSQQDDSTKVVVKEYFFFIHKLVNPTVYDTFYSHTSSRNMEASMRHLGYYKSIVKDTAFFKGKKVQIRYTVTPGPPTLIDTFSYKLRIPELQKIAESSKKESFIIKNTAVTKAAVLSEVGRLVDSFRNNGYYKLTAAELKMRGDSTIAALTTISDDPFEQLELLNEAQKKQDSPTIKLALVIIKPEDTTKLNKYFINKIYVISDFRQGDNVADVSKFYTTATKGFTHYYHFNRFRTALIERNITMHTGDVYKQDEFFNTLNNLSRLGVWQNINIRIVENFDEENKIDLIIELLPARKLSFVNSFDISYSAAGAGNNVAAGNLFGTSLNLSLENKNFAKEAIKMTHNIRFGIEFNNKSRTNSTNLINSNELSYGNNVIVPRKLIPLDIPNLFRKYILGQTHKDEKTETFINSNFSYTNRLKLFNLQTVSLNYGYSSKWRKNRLFSFKLLNAEFSNLYNQSDSFSNLIDNNPFLRYSYNTAFVIGMGANYSSVFRNPRHIRSLSKERTVKLNFEESGLTWGAIPIVERYKKRFMKFDFEYKYAINYKNKTSLNYRFFAGIGIPILKDSALPFFKQFSGGGSNSMRGWPIRGIGRGGQKLAPFNTTGNTFNDRTGDIQIEGNIEFRHMITKLYSDVITLKGAAFLDVGNVWNAKDSKIAGVSDNTSFKPENFIRQLGASVGYGLRFDFTYLVLRTDFGFRIKRPETSDVNYGFKLPDLSFADFFQKMISKNYREWRYENFNFSIGINYPF